MDDLVRWLTACLDEDERIARGAGGLAWFRPEDPGDPAAIRDSEQDRIVCAEGWPSEGQTVHIAEWDPARVLRETEAKRGILEEHQPSELAVYAPHGCPLCHAWPCPTVRLMASVYRDREGYQEEWAP